MTSIRDKVRTVTTKVLIGAQIVAATLPQQGCSPTPTKPDGFDNDKPKTETNHLPGTSQGTPGDGKTISWLDAISGMTAAEAAAKLERQDLTALAKIQVVKNADSTLTVVGLPKHLALPDGIAARGGWDVETQAVVTEGRRELKYLDPRPSAVLTLDRTALSVSGEVRLALPAGFKNSKLPDVVTLTIHKTDGNAYTLPLATRNIDSLNVPDPLGAEFMGKKKSPTFSLDSLRVSDIEQGQVGSCYFLSSIGSLVVRDQSMKSRTVAVDNHRMWVKFDKTPTTSSWVLSDFDQNQGVQARRLPSSVGSRDSLDVMWPVVMEKAWMTFAKSHDYRQEDGGWPVTALKALGVDVNSTDISAITDHALFAKITAGDVYVATTRDVFPPGREGPLGTKDIVTSHAYTVLGADEGKGTIDLYNPWGAKVTVTLTEFREAFDSIYDKKLTPPPMLSAATSTPAAFGI